MSFRSRRWVLYGAVLVFLMVQGAALVYIVVERGSPAGPPVPNGVPTATPGPATVAVVPPDAAAETAYGCLRWDTLALHLSKGLVPSMPGHTTRDVPYESVLATSPDGRYSLRESEWRVFVSGGADGELTLAEDVRDVAPSAPLQGSWSPDSRYLGLAKAALFMMVDMARQTVEKLEFPETYLISRGWSADGAYFVISDFEQLMVWSAAEGGLMEVPIPPDTHVGEALWSPQGHWLAYELRSSGNAPYQRFLSFYSPDSSQQYRLPASAYASIEAWYWSPDGRYLVVEDHMLGSDFNNRTGTIVGRDGTLVAQFPLEGVDVIYAMPISRYTGQFTAWPEGAQSIYWIASDTTDTTDTATTHRLMAYHTGNGATEAVAAGFDYWTFNLPAYSHVAISKNDETGRGVEILNLVTRERMRLVHGADDLGDPVWSPDGRYVTAVWATGQGGGREVSLSWIRADGQAFHHLSDHFWDVRDVRWLADNAGLAYIAQRRDGYRLEVADMATGGVRAIAGPVDMMSELMYDDEVLSFVWANGDEKGLSAYHADGTLAYTLKLTAETDLSARMNVFWSPDQRLAAIKAGPYRDENLQLAASDGTWNRVIRSGLYGLGDPLWSPDSHLLAFTQAPEWGQLSLDVVDAGGGEVWRRAVFPWNLTWVTCDQGT